MKSIRLFGTALVFAIFLSLYSHVLPVHAFPSYVVPEAAGYNLLVGTWHGRDGRVTTITPTTYDGSPYTLASVRSDGFTTVVIFSVLGGHTYSWTVSHGNVRYAMLNDLTTGRFIDTMDFTLH